MCWLGLPGHFMKTINKQSHIPYYYQLADILRAFIRERAAGDETEFLPSENELVQTYQVSRATVRQALSLLEREGLVHKVKGKGTYICKHRVRYPLTKLVATTEDMQRRGWQPGVKVLSFLEIDTHSPITEALHLTAGEKVYELCRLRLGNEQPVGLQWAYLPVKKCPGLIDLDLAASLTQVMEDNFGILFWSAHEFLRARLPTKFEAEHLQIPKNLPVIYMERITFTPEGQPVEFLQSVWRSDLYEYEFSLTRGAG
jgi:GntR family transcriptional regulator